MPSSFSQRVRSVDALVVSAFGIGTGLFVWRSTPNGVLIGTDTVTFLSVARNLVHGNGLTAAYSAQNSHLSVARQLAGRGRIPLTDWPPGYPVLIAIGMLAGLSEMASLRALAIVAGVGLGALVAWIARFVLRLPVVATVAIGVLAIIGPNRPDLSNCAFNGLFVGLSESVFTPLSLAAVGVGLCAVRRPTTGRVGLAVALVAAATMVRASGACLGIALALGVLVVPREDEPGSVPPRYGVMAAFALVGPIVMVVWGRLNRVIWQASSPQRTFAWHPEGSLALHTCETMSAWFGIPATAPSWVVVIATVVFVGLPLAGASIPAARRWLFPADRSRQSASVVLAASMFGTWLVVFLTNVALDKTTNFSARHLGVFQPFAYLLAGLMLVVLLQRLTHRFTESPRWRFALMSVCVLTFFGALVVPAGKRSLDGWQRVDGRLALPQHSWTILGAPEGLVLASSNPPAYAGRGQEQSLLLPARRYLTDGKTNPNFDRDVALIARLARRTPVLIAEADDLRSIDAATSVLRSRHGFTVVAHCDDGTTLLAMLGTSAAAAARRTCQAVS